MNEKFKIVHERMTVYRESMYKVYTYQREDPESGICSRHKVS
jgi:hypothetical protein